MTFPSYSSKFDCYRWKTFAELTDNLRDNREQIIRACGYISPGHMGDKFIQRFLDFIMVFSLKGRLYPKTTTAHKYGHRALLTKPRLLYRISILGFPTAASCISALNTSSFRTS